MYATKEYVDKDKIKWNLYQSKTFSNVVDNSDGVLLDNSKIDELKDSKKVKVVFDNVVFSSIPSPVSRVGIVLKKANIVRVLFYLFIKDNQVGPIP